jgi:hypothetical protein
MQTPNHASPAQKIKIKIAGFFAVQSRKLAILNEPYGPE